MSDNDTFRQEVRSFLEENVPLDILEAGKKSTSVFHPFEQVMKWHEILAKKGWSVPAWPVEYGGTGWSREQMAIFREECLSIGVPNLLPHGIQLLAPLVINLGTQEQKERYLPDIRSGKTFWCQGYSEPGAGSDLASLRCSAVSDGDDYIINGSKTWTTYAHHADKMFLLARTKFDGKPQAGITFILVDDMHAKGITVKEIIGLDGVPEQCEVFFDNVRVPKADRIGDENDGWSVAKYLLVFERGGSSSGPSLYKTLRRVRSLSKTIHSPFGGMLCADPIFQRKLGELEIDIRAIDYTEKRLLLDQNPENAMRVASMKKILSADIYQAFSEVVIELAGLDALPWQIEALKVGSEVDAIGPEFALTSMPSYLNSRAGSIYGGSHEIQRDLIAKNVLGL